MECLPPTQQPHRFHPFKGLVCQMIVFFYRARFLAVLAGCVGILAAINAMFFGAFSENGSVTILVENVREYDVDRTAAAITDHYGDARSVVWTEEDGGFVTLRVGVYGKVADLEAARAPPYGAVVESRLGPEDIKVWYVLIINVPPAVVLAVGTAVIYPKARKLDSWGYRP